MKIRHYLKCYHNLPDFPRADDLHYELSQVPKYLKGESFSYISAKTSLTFKVDKKTWEEMMENLIEENLIEKIDKNNYKLKEKN